MVDIVKRLRRKIDGNIVEMSFEDVVSAEEAADYIERLQETLKPFAKVLKGNWSNQSDDMIMSFGFGNDKRLELTLGDFRKARAALKGNE